MPIFRLEGDKLIPAPETNVELEQDLEIWLENNPRALTQEPLLWIGRQTSASVEERTIFPDLIGTDIEGNLIIVELKRDETPREVVAQLLEYAAWADELPNSEIHKITKDYFETHNEFRGKTFDEAFREVFDVPKTDELPPLKQKLRLFIVAEEILPRVARVCRFLRTSHGMDITCIDVSTFQTEFGEMLVSMETKVGDEDVGTPKPPKRRGTQTSGWSKGKPIKQVLSEAVQELTKGDFNVKFTQKEVFDVISKKYPDYNKDALRGGMNEERVNDTDPDHPSVVNPDGKYWRISQGVYRLYDPEKDKMRSDEKADLVKQGTENPA